MEKHMCLHVCLPGPLKIIKENAISNHVLRMLSQCGKQVVSNSTEHLYRNTADTI